MTNNDGTIYDSGISMTNDQTLTLNSDYLVASSRAIKNYIDNSI
jgi:hypothetical protein